MAARSIGEKLFSGRRKWVTGPAILVVLALVFWGLFGKRIRFEMLVGRLEEETAEATEEIQRLGRGYRDMLRDEVLDGGHRVGTEAHLYLIAFGEPFYLADELRDGLVSDDEIVRRAAVIAYLERDRDPRDPAQKISNDVYDAFARWATPENVDTPLLGAAIGRTRGYRDLRIPELLVPLVRMEYRSETPLEVGRANDARGQAARLLGSYIDRPGVADALVEVVKRDPDGGESDWVQTYALQQLARNGYAGDPALYWVAARSENDLKRQVVAEHLEKVGGEEVVKILRELLFDRREVVRRGALDSLMVKRAPIVMDRLYELAEDQFSSIRGDLADAVLNYRRKDMIPYLGWCLLDTDPIVVEKAMVSLFKLTGKPWALDEEGWEKYRRGSTPERRELIDSFIDDEKQKEEAIAALAEKHPPRRTDRDRIPYLIRVLGHKDPENVKRAMRLLGRITGRKEGFDPAILDPAAPEDAEAEALYGFMHDEGVRDSVIADWERWWAEEAGK